MSITYVNAELRRLIQAQAALAPAFHEWIASTANNDRERANLPAMLLKEGAGGLDDGFEDGSRGSSVSWSPHGHVRGGAQTIGMTMAGASAIIIHRRSLRRWGDHRNEFRKLGWDASDPTLAAVIGVEIDRMKREAATLHKLRAALFGVA